jgi:hypothetical protein
MSTLPIAGRPSAYEAAMLFADRDPYAPDLAYWLWGSSALTLLRGAMAGPAEETPPERAARRSSDWETSLLRDATALGMRAREAALRSVPQAWAFYGELRAEYAAGLQPLARAWCADAEDFTCFEFAADDLLKIARRRGDRRGRLIDRLLARDEAAKPAPWCDTGAADAAADDTPTKPAPPTPPKGAQAASWAPARSTMTPPSKKCSDCSPRGAVHRYGLLPAK